MDEPVDPQAPRRSAPRRRPRSVRLAVAIARAERRSRRARFAYRVVGVLLVLVAIPLGWVGSAAVFGGTARLPGIVGFGQAPTSAPSRFDAADARGARAPGTSLVARPRKSTVAVYRRPRRGTRVGRLRPRRLEGKRLAVVMLVARRKARWSRVYLPTRPNRSLGWVRNSEVRFRTTSYRMRIELRRHRLTVWRNEKVIARKPIGVGRSLSPTPTGRYFVTDLIRARDPRGLYGPYSFGLSAHSNVYTSFRGGNGQIGLHGTNAPEALGSDVSAGCIRLGNRAISALARQVPLGTPVVIQR